MRKIDAMFFQKINKNDAMSKFKHRLIYSHCIRTILYDRKRGFNHCNLSSIMSQSKYERSVWSFSICFFLWNNVSNQVNH